MKSFTHYFVLYISTRRQASCGTLGNGHSNWEGNFPFTIRGRQRRRFPRTTRTLSRIPRSTFCRCMRLCLLHHSPLPLSSFKIWMMRMIVDRCRKPRVRMSQPLLPDLPTTCYHLRSTLAKFAQNDSLKSSLSLSPASEDKVKTTSTLDSVLQEQALPLLLPLPTTFQQLLSKVAPRMTATRVLSHLALTILRLLPPQS